MIRRQITNLEKDIDEIGPGIENLCKDEKAGEKISKYCKKIEEILKRKLQTLKEKFEDIEKGV